MAKNKKNKHNFWKRLHFKYRLSVMNENTLEEIWKIKASIFSGAMLLLVFAFFLVTITSVIIIATPIRYYLPGYLDSEVREKALRSAIKTDSLERRLRYQEAYIDNLRDVFAGVRQLDSIKIIDTISVSENDPSLQKSELEREYTKRYEEEERYNLSVLSSTATNPMEGLVFFKPVKGAIVNKFNPNNENFGVTVKIASKETVSASLEGVVMFAGYDLKTGYTIQIQHKNGFISTYKNNTMLLKKTGDKVRTGEAIAVVEANGTAKETSFEFELWYKGNAMNPENYITF
ncbi:murein DD-endopeptidase MepM/ murein hydrolase activator NlpD [Dysgonomonas sp. PFB1-18]|uniref:murein hydrolase activator EnvC family protein n=1 Tax=unclassified Dysgonomonas TaxID=2630389 RepID=UPI002475B846|nr:MULTISPECIES: M23 family metallopeptidase [unclassified Dysgonomonas]MDH6309865.1 murein DD-endopeptidase MepM/ murein hydrolase activator NlpD [Dysgonomonas sp. PF1-14]MDH6339409.1 murein DD-endopeptidase MepM/ murein hydrolase activator NlpD [Dysgonomonas sp. PF1-16]MDH6380908.1 murein DD-endopeptidase MepM/ murein hydrolase activator NlpD [Dysgonomonas sp. PFB1-18]MDH6397917.1 murein DD-endopeptidase MepM/ murein hydrolase activator NlpD [Dysgonomonas sp. PF1-23]